MRPGASRSEETIGKSFISKLDLFNGRQIGRNVMHIVVRQGDNHGLVRLIGIMHFDFWCGSIARDGFPCAVRKRHGHDEVVLAHQNALQGLTVRESYGYGGGLHVFTAAPPAAAASTARYPCVL